MDLGPASKAIIYHLSGPYLSLTKRAGDYTSTLSIISGGGRRNLHLFFVLRSSPAATALVRISSLVLSLSHWRAPRTSPRLIFFASASLHSMFFFRGLVITQLAADASGSTNENIDDEFELSSQLLTASLRRTVTRLIDSVKQPQPQPRCVIYNYDDGVRYSCPDHIQAARAPALDVNVVGSSPDLRPPLLSQTPGPYAVNF